jgi:flagellar biosynthetic protein FliO
MLFTKHSALLASLILLVSGLVVTVPAQQNPTAAKPIAETRTSAEKVEAPASPTPVPAASESPVDKDADARLSFMTKSENDNHQETPSATGLLLRTFGALLLIVGLIVAAAYGMKRFGGARFGAPKEDAPQLAVLNSISLGERRSLAVVRFGGRTLLIGSTAQAVTLLAETKVESLENQEPTMRSVADMLNGTSSVSFADELSGAETRMEDPERIGGRDIEW